MTKKIYVGNLSFDTLESDVRDMFEPFGNVESIAMITDRDSGRFRGFCFVEMDDADALDQVDISGDADLVKRLFASLTVFGPAALIEP